MSECGKGRCWEERFRGVELIERLVEPSIRGVCRGESGPPGWAMLGGSALDGALELGARATGLDHDAQGRGQAAVSEVVTVSLLDRLFEAAAGLIDAAESEEHTTELFLEPWYSRRRAGRASEAHLGCFQAFLAQSEHADGEVAVWFFGPGLEGAGEHALSFFEAAESEVDTAEEHPLLWMVLTEPLGPLERIEGGIGASELELGSGEQVVSFSVLRVGVGCIFEGLGGGSEAFVAGEQSPFIDPPLCLTLTVRGAVKETAMGSEEAEEREQVPAASCAEPRVGLRGARRAAGPALAVAGLALVVADPALAVSAHRLAPRLRLRQSRRAGPGEGAHQRLRWLGFVARSHRFP